MRLDCTTEKYEQLYARWLPGVDRMLSYGSLGEHDRVMDLCGGTGALSIAAVERGCSSVDLLDLNPRCKDSRVHTHTGRAEMLPYYFGHHSFDLVICRQALGYLDLKATANAVSLALAPGGRFVFNNFISPRWAIKVYRFDGRTYLEVSGHLGSNVWHLQASPSVGVDVTQFQWHKHEDILAVMDRYFHVRHELSDRSAKYYCVIRD